jgi:lipopolysaccharide biosynthesis glycosyltransferase
MDNLIPIFLAADDRYARYCAVTMMSILANTASPERLKFYVLSSDISVENTRKLERLQFGVDNVSVLNIDLSLFDSLPIILKHLNLNMYSRLLIPELCPHLHKIIYLDCDTIVLSDIVELFDTDLEDKPLGAIAHIQQPYQAVFVEKFNVADNDIYFNSGVLVIDTDLWRAHQYGKAVIEYCEKYSDKLHFPDQDSLNVIFWENYYHCSGLWNVETRLYNEKLIGVPQDPETDYRIHNPKILHYAGSNKPWNSSQYVPMRHLYAKYSQQLAEYSGWMPDRPEPKRCSVNGLLQFMWTCLYFRSSTTFRKVFPRN